MILIDTHKLRIAQQIFPLKRHFPGKRFLHQNKLSQKCQNINISNFFMEEGGTPGIIPTHNFQTSQTTTFKILILIRQFVKNLKVYKSQWNASDTYLAVFVLFLMWVSIPHCKNLDHNSTKQNLFPQAFVLVLACNERLQHVHLVLQVNIHSSFQFPSCVRLFWSGRSNFHLSRMSGSRDVRGNIILNICTSVFYIHLKWWLLIKSFTVNLIAYHLELD